MEYQEEDEEDKNEYENFLVLPNINMSSRDNSNVNNSNINMSGINHSNLNKSNKLDISSSQSKSFVSNSNKSEKVSVIDLPQI